ncbi:MAG: YggT family protein [Holosporales bacterium]|jgi:uncharacterized protein YggT (Ycf19 family)|nr:YggT family protein [Holosporales bacterium]
MWLIFYGLIKLLIETIGCLEYVLIAYIIMGWVVMFGVVKNQDSIFFKIYILLMSKIEPVLLVIRRYVPSAFGLDFSAIVVFFAFYFLKVLIIQIAMIFN